MLKKISFFCLVFAFSLVSSSGITLAAKNKNKTPSYRPTQTSLVVDANNGRVLYAENSNKSVYPASLTKLMTLYLTFEAIKKGKLSWHDNLIVSKHAESMRPMKLGLKVGERITVKDAVLALIIHSSNDAAVVLAEGISGSEQSFAKLMTKRAHQIGMRNTIFKNASGWHHPEQKTTAIDLAKLAIAVKRDHPSFYPLFSKNSFEFRGRTVYGHNRVTKNYPGAEGLKTGFTNPSGFNLVTTASRGGKSLVGVVTGGHTAALRDKKMMSLLDKQFGIHPNEVIKKKTPVKKPSKLYVSNKNKKRAANNKRV